MKIKRLHFHEDGGHGWLAVKRTELDRLGLLDKISNYSYQRGKTVYLEEDCDLECYAVALGLEGIGIEFVKHYQERSPIRGYTRYHNLA